MQHQRPTLMRGGGSSVKLDWAQEMLKCHTVSLIFILSSQYLCTQLRIKWPRCALQRKAKSSDKPDWDDGDDWDDEDDLPYEDDWPDWDDGDDGNDWDDWDDGYAHFSYKDDQITFEVVVL